jgi:hypothetical protein
MKCLWLLVLVAAACTNSGSGFAGRYRVLSHTRNASSCVSSGEPVIGGVAYFALRDIDVYGFTAIAYRTCADMNDFTCEGGAPPGAFFGTLGSIGPVEDDVWGSDSASGASGSQSACSFTWTGVRLRHLGGAIQLQVETHQGTRAVAACDTTPGSHLTLEGTTLPCTGLETTTAVAVP